MSGVLCSKCQVAEHWPPVLILFNEEVIADFLRLHAAASAHSMLYTLEQAIRETDLVHTLLSFTALMVMRIVKLRNNEQ